MVCHFSGGVLSTVQGMRFYRGRKKVKDLPTKPLNFDYSGDNNYKSELCATKSFSDGSLAQTVWQS